MPDNLTLEVIDLGSFLLNLEDRRPVATCSVFNGYVAIANTFDNIIMNHDSGS